MRVLYFPDHFKANPYTRLFYKALEPYGVEAEFGGDFSPQVLARIAESKNCDAIHVQWLEYTIEPRAGWRDWVRVFQFMRCVHIIKKNRIKLIWTCHNLVPHDQHRQSSFFLTRLFARCADMIICHSREVKKTLIQLGAKEAKIFYTPHPVYSGYYPDNIGKSDARMKLGISERSNVYLFFGALKPYKGIEELINAFKAFDDPNAILWIVGVDYSKEYARKVLETLAGPDQRIRIADCFIEDTDVSTYYRAADFLVYPFRKIDTSGSLMMAFTYHLPVILKDVLLTRELFDENLAIFFTDESSLVNAFQQVLFLDKLKVQELSKRKEKEYSWSNLIGTLAVRYCQLSGMSP